MLLMYSHLTSPWLQFDDSILMQDGAHDLIGRCTLTLRELSFGPYLEALINPERSNRIGYRSSGGLSINKVTPLAAEQTKVLPTAYGLATSGVKLDIKDATTLSSDPYWELVRVWPPNSGNWITVYRSEVVRKNTSPTWQAFNISADHVGGFDTPFAIRVWDYNSVRLCLLFPSVASRVCLAD